MAFFYLLPKHHRSLTSHRCIHEERREGGRERQEGDRGREGGRKNHGLTRLLTVGTLYSDKETAGLHSCVYYFFGLLTSRHITSYNCELKC